MTDKELRKLKRSDLLEILYYLQKELEELSKENESLKTQLENSKAVISDDDIEKIVKAVKSAARDGFRESSKNDTADNKQTNTSVQVNKEGKHKNGKRNKT